MEKAQGRTTLRPFPFLSDPPYLTFLGAILAGCAFLLAGLHFRLPAFLPAILAAVLFAGISLRVLYTAGTLYSARSYDTPGHVEYIKYVAKEGSLPAARHGIETHQPPLYYVLCAGLMRMLGMESTSSLYVAWQLFSLLLAVGAFLLCYPICLRLLGPPEEKAIPQVLFLAFLAFYPGFVFTSSRVSNDSLFNFLAFLWFWLVLRAWQEPDLRNWILVSLCAGLGVLTKNTMLPLLAVTASLIVLLPRAALGRKVQLLGALTAAVLLIAGWYQFPRLAISDNPADFIVANNDMGPNLRLPRSLDRMATFNPAAVIEIPFHNPWKDETRRMYLAEVFFKTSLFGEWVWGSHLLLPARALVISGLALLLCASVGLVVDLRCRSANFLPVFLTAGAVVGSVLVYFWKLPFACNQDFRFAVLALVPLAYWIARCSVRRPYTAAVMAFLFCMNGVLFLSVLLFV